MFSPETIEQRIKASIASSLDRAERALWELENLDVEPGRHHPGHPRFNRYQLYIKDGKIDLYPLPPEHWDAENASRKVTT